MRIAIKRIYEKPEASDGTRILVDRLWPRGLSKETAQIEYWAKDIAPSNDLRRWYHRQPAKWDEFRARYFAELDASPEAVAALQDRLTETVTFVFASKEVTLNNAVALKEYLETRAR